MAEVAVQITASIVAALATIAMMALPFMILALPFVLAYLFNRDLNQKWNAYNDDLELRFRRAMDDHWRSSMPRPDHTADDQPLGETRPADPQEG